MNKEVMLRIKENFDMEREVVEGSLDFRRSSGSM